jgi:hypothetical protein
MVPQELGVTGQAGWSVSQDPGAAMEGDAGTILDDPAGCGETSALGVPRSRAATIVPVAPILSAHAEPITCGWEVAEAWASCAQVS